MYNQCYSKIILFLILLFTTLQANALILTSTAFQNNGYIPSQYTCTGKNIIPPLSWDKIPANTQTFVITVTDPDAPSGIWTHWLIYNIPATVKSISAGIKSPPLGSIVLNNSWLHAQYDGPCPPSGTHHYIFTLYALDKQLTLSPTATKQDLESAITNHIIIQASLIGFYSK